MNEFDYQIFYNNLKRLCKKQHKRMMDLERFCNVSTGYFSRTIKGEGVLNVVTFFKVKAFFGVEFTELLEVHVFIDDCPFCGGEAELIESPDDRYYVVCTECNCATCTDSDKDVVVEKWNSRVKS